MNTDSPWIPLSHRYPIESDWDASRGIEFCDIWNGHREIFYAPNINVPINWPTHWRRVELPPLPKPKELTQEEKDEAMILAFIPDHVSKHPGNVSLCIWVGETALKSERSHLGMSAEQFVKEIREITSVHSEGGLLHNMNKLRYLLDRANNAPPS